jgi:hypothetical protein
VSTLALPSPPLRKLSPSSPVIVSPKGLPKTFSIELPLVIVTVSPAESTVCA